MKNSNNPTTGKSIMDFPYDKLISVAKSYLPRFDDYQQMSFDNNREDMADFFADNYNQLEALVFNLKEEDLTAQHRNSIRSVIKYTEKMASSLHFS